MEERFNRIEQAMAAKADKADTDRILGAIDSLAKQEETNEHERLAMGGQLDRHEEQIHQLATKVGLKFVA